MKIVITGGAGFLGQRLAKVLLSKTSPITFDQLLLTDVIEPTSPVADARVQTLALDLTQADAASQLIDSKTELLFHLAAIVSSHAEADFDLGMAVNFDVTKALLERARACSPTMRLVFSSSLAVFGGALPDTLDPNWAVTPQSSYGTEKAMCELLINDYSRRGFVDGRVLRLPTIAIRPGKPNRAASSFVSGIIREPLQGEAALCPVGKDLTLWISSPDRVISNLLHAAQIEASQFTDKRTINLPGISVTVGEMIEALTALAGSEVSGRIRFEEDEAIKKIVASWPGNFDIRSALALGFTVDSDISAVIRAFIDNDLQRGGTQ